MYDTTAPASYWRSWQALAHENMDNMIGKPCSLLITTYAKRHNDGPRRPTNCFCSLQVAIAGPAETLVRRGPLQDGAYTFAYSTKTPGTYTITATAAGGHMDGSPATVTASIAQAHAPLCEVTGTPLRVSTIAGQQQQRTSPWTVLNSSALSTCSYS